MGKRQADCEAYDEVGPEFRQLANRVYINPVIVPSDRFDKFT